MHTRTEPDAHTKSANSHLHKWNICEKCKHKLQGQAASKYSHMHACKTAATVTVTAESATHQSHFTSSLTSAANAVALIVDASQTVCFSRMATVPFNAFSLATKPYNCHLLEHANSVSFSRMAMVLFDSYSSAVSAVASLSQEGRPQTVFLSSQGWHSALQSLLLSSKAWQLPASSWACQQSRLSWSASLMLFIASPTVSFPRVARKVSFDSFFSAANAVTSASQRAADTAILPETFCKSTALQQCLPKNLNLYCGTTQQWLCPAQTSINEKTDHRWNQKLACSPHSQQSTHKFGTCALQLKQPKSIGTISSKRWFPTLADKHRQIDNQLYECKINVTNTCRENITKHKTWAQNTNF